MRQARLRTDSGIVQGRYTDGRIVAEDGEYVVGRDGPLPCPCSPSAIYCVGRNYAETLDQQDRTARKAFDGPGPLGPWIETDLDPEWIGMRTEINGETRQDSNTELMLFSPSEIVSFLSHRFTLRSGDVIAFGSPANPGTVEPGDVIEITYDGVGTLRNRVVEASHDSTADTPLVRMSIC